MFILTAIFVILVFIGLGILIKYSVMAITALVLVVKNRGELTSAFTGSFSESYNKEIQKKNDKKAAKAAKKAENK